MNMIPVPRWKILADEVAEKFGVTRSDILTRGHKRKEAQEACREWRYRMKYELKFTWQRIAKISGLKSHTSIQWSVYYYLAERGDASAIKKVNTRRVSSHNEYNRWWKVGAPEPRTSSLTKHFRREIYNGDRVQIRKALNYFYEVRGTDLVYGNTYAKMAGKVVKNPIRIGKKRVPTLPRSIVWFMISGVLLPNGSKINEDGASFRNPSDRLVWNGLSLTHFMKMTERGQEYPLRIQRALQRPLAC